MYNVSDNPFDIGYHYSLQLRGAPAFAMALLPGRSAQISAMPQILMLHLMEKADHVNVFPRERLPAGLIISEDLLLHLDRSAHARAAYDAGHGDKGDNGINIAYLLDSRGNGGNTTWKIVSQLTINGCITQVA
jgi:hypothetical protein